MGLLVASWNIHKGRDFIGRKVDIQHSLDLIAKQEWDVCCLQEVPLNAIQSYSNRSGFQFAYGLTRPIRGDQVGNAIMVRAGTIEDLQNLNISAHILESRCALFAKVSLAGHESMIVSSTHFGLTKRWRISQVHELVGFIEECTRVEPDLAWGKIVIGGDFNDHSSDVAHVMRLHGFHAPSHTGHGRSLASFPSIAPIMPLDCIYVKGGRMGLAVIPSRGLGWHRHSDHMPIVAQMDFSA
jgi:endonuclease/exonuclease/phosphatase family metal-dependent hydrolase